MKQHSSSKGVIERIFQPLLLSEQCRPILKSGEWIPADKSAMYNVKALLDAKYIEEWATGEFNITQAGREHAIDTSKLIAYAQERFADWSIRPDEWEWEAACPDTWFIWEVVATNKRTGTQLLLTKIWIDEDTNVLQCGSNYGVLSL